MFVTGKPCRKCGGTKRYRSTRACVVCARESASYTRQNDPDRHLMHQIRYRKNWYLRRATPPFPESPSGLPTPCSANLPTSQPQKVAQRRRVCKRVRSVETALRRGAQQWARQRPDGLASVRNQRPILRLARLPATIGEGVYAPASGNQAGVDWHR